MIDGFEPVAESNASLPPILRTELESPPLAPRPWYLTIGPAYLGIFVWAPFFDSLWTGDLARYPLWSLIGSAVVASLLCFGLLYFIPAMWGFRTGRPLGIVAASTFGTVGSEWITGVAVGVGSIVWYAVAIDYAVDSTLLGLKACGLVAADRLQAWHLGPIVVKSPVYLCTALFWIYITGTAGLWQLPGVVVALMRIYAPVALLLLTAVALWMLPSVGTYRPEEAASIMAYGSFAVRWGGHHSVVQLITGFFAIAGLASGDGGGRVKRRRDVMLGGLTGIVLAASLTAIMCLVVVAGTVARVSQNWHYGIGDDTYVTSPDAPYTSFEIYWYYSSIQDPFPLSFRWAVYYGIGGIPAGGILILFGLAALAPACYSAWVYGQKLSTHWPRLGQSAWTWLGGAIAFVLGATSCANQLDWIFIVMGVVFAPVVGAMAGDFLRQRGAWAGVRLGFNRSGIIAWGAGVGIGLALEVGRVATPDYHGLVVHDSPWWYSSSICGFVASFLYYSLLARLGKERPPCR